MPQRGASPRVIAVGAAKLVGSANIGGAWRRTEKACVGRAVECRSAALLEIRRARGGGGWAAARRGAGSPSGRSRVRPMLERSLQLAGSAAGSHPRLANREHAPLLKGLHYYSTYSVFLQVVALQSITQNLKPVRPPKLFMSVTKLLHLSRLVDTRSRCLRGRRSRSRCLPCTCAAAVSTIARAPESARTAVPRLRRCRRETHVRR